MPHKMKVLILIGILIYLNLNLQANAVSNFNTICFFDVEHDNFKGPIQFNLKDLEAALQFCTHIVYGYADIKADTLEVIKLNEDVADKSINYAAIADLKKNYPHIKFLLSIGGDHDVENSEKYIKLLEAKREKQQKFIESAQNLLRTYYFDGLDLSFPLPRNKPRKVHTELGMAWKGFKKLFTGNFIVDEKAEEHRTQFTNLVKDLKTAFEANSFLLTLTVLPNVNSSWYFDASAIINNLDFVNLAAFDFVTPKRNPEEADYASPLYQNPEDNRLPHYNANFQVEHWLKQRVAANKINLGIPTYGRAWNMTLESGNSGLPIVANTNGPAMGLIESHEPGKLNYQDICRRLISSTNIDNRGIFAPLNRVPDPTKRFGVYAYRIADENGQHGLWVSYEDTETAAYKVDYVKHKNLGGVALFYLTNDDFHGSCKHGKYPILQSIKNKLV